MNVGLLYTPVSIYQMTRGALVLFVGVLSVIFLHRRLWLYQSVDFSSCIYLSLIGITLKVAISCDRYGRRFNSRTQRFYDQRYRKR